MSGHRSWDDVKRTRAEPSAAERARIEEELDLADARMRDLDLIADLNAQGDEGKGWSALSDAVTPARVRPGAMLLAGDAQAQAVVRVVNIDDDGQVHFVILPGPVAENRRLLDRPVT